MVLVHPYAVTIIVVVVYSNVRQSVRGSLRCSGRGQRAGIGRSGPQAPTGGWVGVGAMVGAAEPFLRDGGSGGGREVRAPGRLVLMLRGCVTRSAAGAQAATCRDVSQSICQSGSLSVSFPGQTWFLDVGVELLSFGCECEHNLAIFPMSLRIGLSYRLAFLATAVAIAPSKPFASLPPAPSRPYALGRSMSLPTAPSRPYALGRSMSRTSILKQALGLLLLPSTASAAEKKPNVKDVVAQLEASTPKEERNAAGDKADHFPKIAFEGSQGQGKKIVFTVPHENLSPPGFSYIEYMWIKDESSGDILTAKKFTQSDPNLVITAYGSSGQKLTAASKDNKFGIWEGTFLVP